MKEEQVQSRSGKGEVKEIVKKESLAPQYDTVLITGQEKNQPNKPNKTVKTVYRAKPTAKPINTCVSQPLVQRSSAKEDNKDKANQEEASRKLPQCLLGFVNGSFPAPLAVLQVPQIGGQVATIPNPDYQEWFRADQIVRAWLLGSLSEEILSEVTGTTATAQELWLALAKHFNKVSSSRLFELQSKLQTSEKLDRPMAEYLRDIKHICEQLASIGNPVPDKMKIFAALKGLGRDYEPIKVSIEGMIDLLPPITFEDAASRLKSFADRLSSYNTGMEISPHLAFYTNYSGKGRGNSYGRSGGSKGRGGFYSTKGRGFPQQITSNESASGSYGGENKIICQICGKPGHPALKCWHRFNNSYQYEELPSALAALRITDVTEHGGNEWVGDSGATAHVTNSPHHLQRAHSYAGSDQIMIGDGNFLPITHTGSTSLQTTSGKLPLNDVLVCPDIAKPLLSVSKLTTDYPCSFEFDCDGVRVNDKATKKLLILGNKHNGLYVLKDSPLKAFYSSRQQSATEDIWHRRLGHPNHQVLHHLVTTKSISVNKGIKRMCEACQLGKSSRLPFSSSTYVASRPLERIHCDLWGPAPIMSVQGFRYYVIFIDNYSRFCWFYPLKQKSDFFSIFTVFQAKVENQLNQKIGVFQCDGGGEFMSKQFLTHLQQVGIQQFVSCPYTPQQNGLAERKHRHIIELGLSMLFQGRVPQRYWVEAFYTASFLINLLPTPVLLNNCSPHEALLGNIPDYTALRVFGCACYPTLRDYAKTKFDPRSLKCVFMGYNEKYKGYRCLLPSTGRVYISRHVLFDEEVFPFALPYKHLQPSDPTPLMKVWLQSLDLLPNRTTTLQREQESDTSKVTPLFTLDEFPPLPSRSTAVVVSGNGGESSECTTGFDPASIGNSSSPSSSRTSTPTQASPILSEKSTTSTSTASTSQNSSPGRKDLTVSAPVATQAISPDISRVPTSEPILSIKAAESSQNTSDEIAMPEVSRDQPSTCTEAPSAIQSTHQMVTRSKAGTHKPNPRYALMLHKVSYPEPKTVTAAMKDEGWNNAMHEEIENCKEAETWSLIPYTPDMHVLGCKWVFRTKLNADGSLDKLKARLVAKGFDQEEGIDYLETYSPVVRTATVRSILHVATIMNWEIKQMDVKNAFLHGDLTETVYMKQPTGFIDPPRPDYVCHLHKSLYGLKQSPRAWFDKFSSFLLEFGFFCSQSDPSLFVYIKNKDIILLLLYVDDMAITGNNSTALSNLLEALNKQFRMKDMGKLHYFLGIQAHYHSGGLFLSQHKYTEDLLIVASMADCAPMPTPLPLQLNKVPAQDETFSNPTYFRSLAGKLQYLTLTRPDIQFAVNYVCQKMHAPTVSDYNLLKRIIRYIKGTTTMGISFERNTDCTVRAYSDSDHAGCKTTRRSTAGFCTFFGSNIISWASQKQETVARSSTEAEYRALSDAAAEITWLCKVLKELQIPLHQAPELYGDNLSSIYLTANPAFHKRSKHFETHYHYVRERVALGSLTVKHIPSHLQLADIFTKSLPVGAFTNLRFKLGVCYPPTPSLRGTINETKPLQRSVATNQENVKKMKEEQVQSRSGKGEVKEIVKKESLAPQYDTVLITGQEKKQPNKPNKTVKTVYRAKPTAKPINTCVSQPLVQRSSAKEDNKDKANQEEASRKLPQVLKTKTSCPIQQIKVTNRFAVLDNEVEAQ
ncbi:GAG-pre-integrase domain [Arabidopsis suecica]|uniref:GAG-pre-integrase domain n=1 Tax=Arabidopsis suecica TaxID=45249 RepID=A0A8T1YN24_ARASU|nr:GAG-pre-integrase domain [Arabidopsis suecica]